MLSPFFIEMDFVSDQNLVYSSLTSIVLSDVFPCVVSLGGILVLFNNLSFSKLNYYTGWNLTWFILEFSPTTPVNCCVGLYPYFPLTPLNAQISIIHSMFPIYFCYLSSDFSFWETISFVVFSHYFQLPYLLHWDQDVSKISLLSVYSSSLFLHRVNNTCFRTWVKLFDIPLESRLKKNARHMTPPFG